MRIHILGICGTFMGGLAMLARQLGHEVTGSDANVYPPMSTLLEKQGIELIQGYDASQLDPQPDLVIIGNAMTRGNPCVEAVLEKNIPYMSGPQWLHDFVLRDRWVLAVAGTHGKTTTAGMATWILEQCGYKPGFVIGGVPGNFEVSARLGESDFFVIEADEYDCAFFDKRSKFVHYCPRTLILNNLEFDHADIFDDLKAIQKQFHHLVRIVPGQGRIIWPENDINLKQTMAMGCWSEQELVGEQGHWQAKKLTTDASEWEVLLDGEKVGEVKWSLVGEHNMHNGLMAIAAARHVGVAPADAANALGSFINARRRLELRGEANGVTVYDDFAHHPTAILATLAALRGKVGGTARIIAVLEPRSNTMKMGICKDDLAPSLGRADEVFLLQPAHIPWQVAEVAEACVQPAHWSGDVDTLADMVVKTAQPGDHILVMSNGGFGGIHQKLLDGLAKMSIVPDATLDASYQAYRCTASGKPYSHQQRKLPFILRQFAQILENLACGFRRLIPFFLFLRVADQSTQLLTIGIGPQIQYFSDGVITLIDQTIAQVFQFMEQHHLLVVTVFQLIQRLTNRLYVALAQHLTDELQLAAATFHLNTLGELNSRAQIRI